MLTFTTQRPALAKVPRRLRDGTDANDALLASQARVSNSQSAKEAVNQAMSAVDNGMARFATIGDR